MNPANVFWTDRYRAIRQLTPIGSVQRHAVIHRDGSRALVFTAPRADARISRKLLDHTTALHHAARGPGVPAMREVLWGDEHVAAVYDCGACIDLEELAGTSHADQQTLTYVVGTGFVKMLMSTLERVHTVTHAGAPVCLGLLGTQTVMFDAEGELWLVGFGGFPVSLRAHEGRVYQAPEVAAGSAPTPGADLFAVTLLVRSLMGSVELPPAGLRVLQGAALPEDGPLVDLLVVSNLQILAGYPDRRPGMAEGHAMSRKVWAHFGIEPDDAGYRAWVRRILARASERARTVLTIMGANVRLPGGEQLDLSRHASARRLLVALAEEYVRGDGSGLALDQLVAAGWPGEVMSPASGANRVHVALTKLRKLGLRELLVRDDACYRLAPGIEVRIGPA